MTPKQIIIVSTMALVISIGALTQNEKSEASASAHSLDKSNAKMTVQDDLHRVLGVSSDEEIYDALYNGKSLADIAMEHNMDVQNVIDLQTAQLSEQMDLRLASGSLTPEQYESQKSELRDIITNSVYGRINNS